MLSGFILSLLNEVLMARSEKTSKRVASKASKILRDPKSTKAMKSVAASALTQRPDKRKKK
jgi:hypothetical protein